MAMMITEIVSATRTRNHRLTIQGHGWNIPRYIQRPHSANRQYTGSSEWQALKSRFAAAMPHRHTASRRRSPTRPESRVISGPATTMTKLSNVTAPETRPIETPISCAMACKKMP